MSPETAPLRFATFAITILFVLAGAVLPSEASAQGTSTSVAPLPPVLNGDDRWGFNAIYPDSSWVQLAKNAGARWNRWVFAWDSIQPARGQFRYGDIDGVVSASRQAGFSTDAILIGIPAWAKDQRTQMPSGLYLSWNDPQNLWAQFVLQTAAHYKGQIRYWEVWNEPDDSQISWAGTTADYYQLLKVSYLTVKSVDPSAEVILAGLAYWTNPQFLPDLLRIMVNDTSGRTNHYYFDILALHSYTRPSDVPDRVALARGQLATTVGDRPIWLNETNVAAWNVSGQNRFVPFQWGATTSEQASYIIQAFAYAIASGVDKVMVYRFHNVGELINYALVDSNGALYPGYVAYQVAVRYFSQATAASISHQGDVEQVVLSRPGERVTVAWNRTPAQVTTRIGAQTLTATAVDQAGASRSLQATAGQYQLNLPAATANQGLTGTDFIIGGQPLIIDETLPGSQQSAGILSPLVAYAGEWPAIPTAGSSAASVRRTVTAGAAVAIGFEGQSVTWTTTKGPDRGTAQVVVDGLLQGEIDLYSPTAEQQVPLTFGPFTSGRHRLTITATGRRATVSSAAAVEMDSVSSTSLYATQPPPAPPTPTPSPTPTPVSTPGPTMAIIGANGGTTALTLPSGQVGRVTISADRMAAVRTSNPNAAQAEVAFNPAPIPPNAAAAGSLGGGVVVPVSGPVGLQVHLTDSSGHPLALARGDPASQVTADVTLPATADAKTIDPNGVFAWLQEIDNPDDGSFSGYIRPPADFDPTTNSVTIHPGVASLQHTLLLPAVLVPAWVANFDDSVHIYSGPDSAAIDFGVAGPAFTTFSVVAPQVGSRLYAFDAASSNYGWIDVSGVGPAGPPT